MGKKITVGYVRDNFPECVAFADQCRAVFGDGVKMIYANEKGKVIGKEMSCGCVQNLADIDLTPIMSADELRRSGRGE